MLKRICACYNSRTYGSRWVLVCPAVFKTVAGGEELPRWVRFPHTLANGNRSGSAAPVFVHFNPSVKPLVCQLPGRGAFWHCASTNYKPALKGDSSRARPVGDAARGESGGIGSVASGSKARRPYSNQRSWHEVTKGEWLKAVKLFYCSPSVSPTARQLPRKRWRLLCAIL